MSCDRCNISGSLPGGWFGMTNLRVISLADNNITGQLVSFGADNLESLVMDRNPMTWLDTWLVARWKKLKKLSLQGCNLQSGLLAGVTAMLYQAKLRVHVMRMATRTHMPVEVFLIVLQHNSQDLSALMLFTCCPSGQRGSSCMHNALCCTCLQNGINCLWSTLTCL